MVTVFRQPEAQAALVDTHVSQTSSAPSTTFFLYVLEHILHTLELALQSSPASLAVHVPSSQLEVEEKTSTHLWSLSFGFIIWWRLVAHSVHVAVLSLQPVLSSLIVQDPLLQPAMPIGVHTSSLLPSAPLEINWRSP